MAPLNKAEDMGVEVDWSELQTDLLDQIARLLPMMEDLMAFRGVCTGWRSAVPTNKFVSVSKVPLLMLGEKTGSQEREFYSLSKRKICMRKHLPEAKSKRCIDVGFGWVLALDSQGTAILFKPLSSAAKIELPSYKKFSNYSQDEFSGTVFFITYGVLTANPSETSDFKLVVNTKGSSEALGGSGVWKNGDEDWTEIRAQTLHMLLRPDGKLYTLVCCFTPWIEIWDPLSTDLSKPQATVQVRDAPHFLSSLFEYYLVESTDGDLLLIMRHSDAAAAAYGLGHFGVRRVDLAKGECIKTDDLGKDAIFVGDNVAVAVDATEFPGVLKPNCIYFTDDHLSRYHEWCLHDDEGPDGDGEDMGIYNVKDRSFERLGVESSSDTPIWVFPSF